MHYAGRLFLNATSHVYFDKKTYAGEVRFYQYVIRLLNVYMCIDTIRLPNRSMVRWLVAQDWWRSDSPAGRHVQIRLHHLFWSLPRRPVGSAQAFDLRFYRPLALPFLHRWIPYWFARSRLLKRAELTVAHSRWTARWHHREDCWRLHGHRRHLPLR